MNRVGFFLAFFLFAIPAKNVDARDIGCSAMKCHEDLSRGAVVHGPIKAKGCVICHENTPGKTKVASGKLPAGHPALDYTDPAQASGNCVICHDTMSPLLKDKVGVHKPILDKGCTECHDPHHSEHPRLLKTKAASPNCVGCHAEIQKTRSEATHHHAAIFEKKSCLGCHDPHGGTGQPRLLKASVTATCLTCHAKSLSATDGHALPEMSRWKKGPNPHSGTSHKPAECTDCHAAHGNQERALLKGKYSEHLHATSFDTQNAELCFQCHKTALATETSTRAATGFRNGEENLHALHLKGARRARTCRACHNPHGTVGPKLIPDWVPSENISLPIQFQATATGGNCATACHGRMAYDRNNAVTNEPKK